MTTSRRKGRAFALLLATTALSCGLIATAVPSGASPREPITLNDTYTRVPASGCPAGFPEAVSGTATASGVSNQSFTLNDCFHFGNSTLHAQRTLSDENGTINMTLDGKVTSQSPGPPTTLTIVGDWTITNATGAYEHSDGQGSFTVNAVEGGTITEVDTGQAYLG